MRSLDSKLFIIIFLGCLLTGFNKTFGQHFPSDFKYYSLEKYETPNAFVNSIAQDSSGFIWLGTNDGLFRYDGYKFKVYRYTPNDPGSLPADQLWDIFVDTRGTLWVGTSKGLSRYDLVVDNFCSIPIEGDNQEFSGAIIISQVFEDSEGILWFGSNNNGLFKLNETKDTLLPHALDSNGTKFPGIDKGQTLTEDRQGRLWIGTREGLYYRNPGKQTFIQLNNDNFGQNDFLSNHIKAILEDSRGNILIGTLNGLFEWSGNDSSFIYLPEAGEKKKNAPYLWIHSILEDRQGQIWVATGDSVRIKETVKDEWRTPIGNDNKPLLGTCILEDRAGDIWIGTEAGVYYYNRRGKAFDLFRHETGNELSLKTSWATSFFERKDGRIWVGTNEGGVHLFNRKDETFVNYSHDPHEPKSLASDIVFSLFEDQDNTLWVATIFGGINKLQFPHKAFRVYPHPKRTWTLYGDSKGDLWANNNESGLVRYDKENDHFIEPLHQRDNLEKLGIQEVYHFLDDTDGNFWVAAGSSGLFLYDRYTEQFIRPPGELGAINETVGFIQEDSNGNLWIATSSGLIMADRKSARIIAHYTESNGLANHLVMCILEDEHGNIWASTANGLSRLNPETGSFKNYTSEDGLGSGHFSTRACMKTSDGMLFFGGRHGFITFFPDSLKDNPVVPSVLITDFELLNKPVAVRGTIGDTSRYPSPLIKHISVTERLQLRHWQNSLSFRFTAISFRNAHKNKFKYKLEGYNKNWIEANSEERVANYTNLDPGNYTFKVIGSNNDGVWNLEGASLRMLIRAPWYWAWWSKMIYFLLILGSIWGVYNFHLNRRLAAAEMQRLRELDQVKTKLYTNITHEFRTPLTVIQGLNDQNNIEAEKLGSKKISENSRIIKRNSTQLLSLINQLLDLGKLESGKLVVSMIQGNIVAYLKYVFESFHYLAETKGIELHFSSDQPEFLMDYDPEWILQIVSNLLSNAMKFTPEGGEVSFTVRSKIHSLLILSVKDTGIGIPTEELSYIFDRFYQVDDDLTRKAGGTGIGLTLTKELVKLMKGEITVESEVGKGTKFKVVLPVSQKAELTGTMESVETLGRKQSIAPTASTKKLPLALVIEDNPDVVQYIRSCLEGEYRLETAYDGLEGVNKAFRLVPDIIISDVMMPEKDGFEVCENLKMDERTSHIPIILLTAKADVQSRITGLQRGADAYLTKPFNNEELSVRLEQLIELRGILQKRYQDASALIEAPTPARQQDPLFELEDAFLQRIRDLINANLSDTNFGNAELCQAMALSRSQLFRKLKALTGHSVVSFIRSYRLHKARQLLLSEDLNVSEVAYDMGFTDPGYFARVFKREFGIAPSEVKGSK